MKAPHHIHIVFLLILLFSVAIPSSVDAQIPNPVGVATDCQDTLYIGNGNTPGFTVPSATYTAQSMIYSDATVTNPDSVVYISQFIELTPGFKVEISADFAAIIGTCTPVDPPIAIEIDAGPDHTICPGMSVVIGPDSTMLATYSWSPVNGLNDPNIPNPVADPASNTTYVLTVTTPDGLTGTDAMNVFVSDTPSAYLGPDQSICPGESIQIGLTPQADFIYSWTPTTGLSNPNIANPIASPGSTTSYTLTISSPLCTYTAEGSLTITVSPQADADAGPDQYICLGESIQIGSTPVPGYTYVWSPATGVSDINIANPIVTPTANTTYTVLVSSPNCFFSDIDKVNVIIVDAAYADAGEDITICVGECAEIGAPASLGYTYTWSPAFGLSNPNIAMPIACPGMTTTYTLTVNSPNCGQSTAEVTVIIEDAAYTANAGNDQTICLGESVNIGVPGLPGFSYDWSPTTGLSNPNIANPSATPSETTLYTLTVTSDDCNTLLVDEVLVIVDAVTYANAGDDQTICLGQSVQLGDLTQTPQPGYIYSWTPTDGLDDPTSPNPIAIPNGTTTYTLTVVSPNCTNPGTDQVVVTVSENPVASAGQDQTVCAGQGVQIGTTPVTGFNYTWSPAAGLSESDIANPIATPGSTTTYSLLVTSSGCDNIGTDQVEVFVEDAPVADAGDDDSICPGESVVIGVTPQVGFVYSWSPATGLSNSNISNPTANPASTTAYTLTVSSPYCSNTSTSDVLITVSNTIVADAGPDRIVCDGGNVGIGTTFQQGYVYSWSPTAGLSDPNIANPMASPGTTTTYTLTVSSPNCNSDTDQVTVSYSNSNIVFPNNEEICSGGSVQLTAAGGIYYEWSPATGLNDANIPNPIASPEITTPYTLTVTDVNGCVITGQVVVLVVPGLNVNAGQDVTICAGNTVPLSASGADTYSWSPATNLTCYNCPNPNATVSSTTTYTVTGYSGDNCTGEDQITITIEPENTIQFSYDISGCLVTFTPSILNLSEYLWDLGDGNTSSTNTVVHEYTYNGTFQVCLTVSGNCETENGTCQTIQLENCNCATSGGGGLLPLVGSSN